MNWALFPSSGDVAHSARERRRALRRSGGPRPGSGVLERQTLPFVTEVVARSGVDDEIAGPLGDDRGRPWSWLPVPTQRPVSAVLGGSYVRYDSLV
jgi:hypothetical protein